MKNSNFYVKHLHLAHKLQKIILLPLKISIGLSGKLKPEMRFALARSRIKNLIGFLSGEKKPEMKSRSVQNKIRKPLVLHRHLALL